MGKNKYIETPQKLWELFTKYKTWCKDNPVTIEDYVGKEAQRVMREKPRALTMEGFECFVMDNTKITYPDLTEYFEGKNESYKEYFPISARIHKEIRRNQIEGGLAGVLNSSITARLNGLTDKQEIKNEQPNELTVKIVRNKKKPKK